MEIQEPDTMTMAIERIRKEGWCTLEGIIPDNKVASIGEEILETSRRKSVKNNPKGHTSAPGFINHCQSFTPYLANPKVKKVVDSLLGKHARISFTTAILNESKNERGVWHSDWPFNANNVGHIEAPYPTEAIFHITSLWFFTPFNEKNGGTLLRPRSHKLPTNPTQKGEEKNKLKSYPDEIQATGSAGSVLIMNSQLWHARAVNDTEEARIAIAIRFAPWWLNLDLLMPKNEERKLIAKKRNLAEKQQQCLTLDIYNQLPEKVKPLYRHWVQEN